MSTPITTLSPYLSQSDKDSLNAEFFNLHQTFARDIIIWKAAQQIVISTNPSNNFLFDSTPFNDTTQTVRVSGIFKARILYPAKEDTVPFDIGRQTQGSAQNVIQIEQGTVRIRLDATGAAYLFEAKEVTFDDEVFSITSSKRPHSLFGPPNFFDFTLKKQN